MSHPPNLKTFAVSQGKDGSRMYFCRAICWTKDHWGTTIIREKKNMSQTENLTRQPLTPPKKFSEVTSLFEVRCSQRDLNFQICFNCSNVSLLLLCTDFIMFDNAIFCSFHNSSYQFLYLLRNDCFFLHCEISHIMLTLYPRFVARQYL